MYIYILYIERESLWGLIFVLGCVCVFWGGGFWGVPQDLGVDAVKNVGGVLISGDFSYPLVN